MLKEREQKKYFAYLLLIGIMFFSNLACQDSKSVSSEEKLLPKTSAFLQSVEPNYDDPNYDPNATPTPSQPEPTSTPTLTPTPTPWEPINEYDKVAGVDTTDALIPTENLRVQNMQEAASHFVQSCDEPGRYEKERQLAISEAKADPKNTIPVVFSVSFGTSNDYMALWAHQRAILSKDNFGFSYIPMGPRNSASGDPLKTYYKVNHDTAKDQFIKGDRCFFSTVKIIEKRKNNSYYDFLNNVPTDPFAPGMHLDNPVYSPRHMVHYEFYGALDESKATVYSNRLYNPVPSQDTKGEPQIVKLFVADLRESQINLGKDLLTVDTGTKRGVEILKDARELIDLEKVFQNFSQAVRNLSSDYTDPKTKYIFTEIVGAPQLLYNLFLVGMNGSVLANQYTPIVLDLGAPKVQTSSLTWGTYFNMAGWENTALSSASAIPGTTGSATGGISNGTVATINPLAKFQVPHLTAWLGGALNDKQADATDGKSFPSDFRRETEDGFLALPDEDGMIRSSRNLFGDNITINGKKFLNGFYALQSLANKNCNDEFYQRRYIGPWDGDLFKKTLKVWIDKNRNGISEPSEITTLPEAGVLVLNPCNIVHREEKDIFGNGTSLRSTFIYAPNNLDKSDEEIQSALIYGRYKDGSTVEFRLLIDIFFKVQKDKFLKKYNNLKI